MSVQGTILVLDGVSTNRIMLKVQLTAAWYHVVQGERLKGLAALVRRTRPDLVLTAETLPDGTASDVKKLIARDPELADVPVVAIAAQNDKNARLRALADGLDDVLTHPFKDTLLLARIRSLLRARAETQDLRVQEGPHPIGFAEPAVPLIAPTKMPRVAVFAQSARTGALWHKALTKRGRHNLTCHVHPNLHGILSGVIPDAIVVELGSASAGLNLLADLRSRSATRHTVLIGVLPDQCATRASEALDRGADAVCLGGFCVEEVLLRLDHQIARKIRMDHMRASLKRGIADSWIDPLTGLYNRRYAMRAVEKIASAAMQTGHGFAVMLADLDHFKIINDSFGHASGDLVLTEAASRIQSAIGSEGLVARIGGEEFMIAVPNITRHRALRLAETICDRICNEPFHLVDHCEPVPVTISIGVRMSSPQFPEQGGTPEPVDRLLGYADKALYCAKKAGRNQVMVMQNAA